MKKKREGFCPCEQKIVAPANSDPLLPMLTKRQEKLEADYKASRLFKPGASKPASEGRRR